MQDHDIEEAKQHTLAMEEENKYVITQSQLDDFVEALERRYGDHTVHTSCIILADKIDPLDFVPDGFDGEIQFWVDGIKKISLPLKLLKEVK